MPISYDKLFLLLEHRGLRRANLKDILSDPTIAKLGKREPVNTKILCAICAKLHCDISDIAEYIYDESECVKQDMNNRRKPKG